MGRAYSSVARPQADGYHSAHYVKTSEDAAAVGLNAGLDQEAD